MTLQHALMSTEKPVFRILPSRNLLIALEPIGLSKYTLIHLQKNDLKIGYVIKWTGGHSDGHSTDDMAQFWEHCLPTKIQQRERL